MAQRKASFWDFPRIFGAGRARMLLHGPFVGGAYKYIDPTPSKNVSAANSMLPPAALDATRAHAHRCGAGMEAGMV